MKAFTIGAGFFLTALFARTPIAAAFEDCADMKPQATSSFAYGALATCGGDPCPQNYTITYKYECTTPSSGSKCVPGSALIARKFDWTCEEGRCTALFPLGEEIFGPALVAAACPKEDPE